MTALLGTRGLTVEIAGKTVCRDFNFSLPAGSITGILGPNGVGKTTLLHTLAGVRAPQDGNIQIAGKSLTSWPRRLLARQLGLLLQDRIDPFPATVLETALIGRHPHMDFWRWESHEDVKQARKALKIVHLDGLEQRPQNQLSGGERRRLALATLLTQAPDIYLLDEPTNHLDLQHQLSILTHFAQLTREHNKAVLLTLHDINLIARYCDSVMLLYGDGVIHQGPTETVLTEDNLSRLYGTPVVRIQQNGHTAFLA
ncbi:MAG TPA: ABC transporter ATP-binding protein [Gammaproteobacteria bacterium]|nr:ABC transporter ATP-binding protein [Gammaproteobacteria bacterium]